MKHHNTDSKILNSIKQANSLERNRKVAICRNTFRILIGQKKKDKFQRYCPSIEGAGPAFKHSANNLKKLLGAGFQVSQRLRHGDGKFSEEPFRQQFPNNTEISTQRWRHAFKALRETLRSFNLDADMEWKKHHTFLLSYLGLYQGWVDPNQVLTSEEFVDGRKDQQNVLKFVDDLYHQKENPSVPALGMRRNLDGLNTPSKKGDVRTIESMEQKDSNNTTWSKQEKFDVSHYPTSHHPAPIFGELNNISPPMFIDHDPNVLSAFEAVVFIQVEVRLVQQLERNKQARSTRYDTRHDPAWHRRADQTEYQVMNMVKYTDTVQYPVKSLDELRLVDKNNVPIQQEYLELMVDYLNGRKFIPGSDLSARNTTGATVRSQKQITKDIDGGHGNLPEDVRREQNRAYHALDKTALTMIRLANRLNQARCGVVFVTSGTGMFNCDARRNMCLLAEIPHAIMQDRQHFKQVVDHFQLKNCQKQNPRYVDYLEDGTAIFQMTLKPLRGKQAFHRTSADKVLPDDRTYTDDQCRMYQRVSNGVDICTNMASWLVFRKDENMPASEYILALEGSPELWSHWAHVSNVIEDFYGRKAFDKNNKYVPLANGGLMTVKYGAFKRIGMLRDDCKMRIINCVADLEDAHPDSKPFKVMRYPVEDGNAIQRVLQQRAKILVTKVTITILLIDESQTIFFPPFFIDRLTITIENINLVQNPNQTSRGHRKTRTGIAVWDGNQKHQSGRSSLFFT